MVLSLQEDMACPVGSSAWRGWQVRPLRVGKVEGWEGGECGMRATSAKALCLVNGRGEVVWTGKLPGDTRLQKDLGNACWGCDM